MEQNVTMARHAVEGMKFSPVRQHREVRKVAQKTVEWAARFSLATSAIELARVRGSRVGELAAYTFSREKVEIVQLVADLVTWQFLFDDAVGEAPPHLTEAEHRQLLASYERVIREQHLPEQPSALQRALLNLVLRAVELGATADWLERFANDMSDYFAGCADESQYRRTGRVPTVAAYRKLRRQTVGVSPVLAIIELGVGGVVDGAEMARADVVEARGSAGLLAAWVNDVYSFPKEAAAHEPLNLVIALATEYQLDVREALELAVEVYNRDLLELERIIDEVRATHTSSALMAYLEGMLEWVHGNRVWTRLCGRYF